MKAVIITEKNQHLLDAYTEAVKKQRELNETIEIATKAGQPVADDLFELARNAMHRTLAAMEALRKSGS